MGSGTTPSRPARHDHQSTVHVIPQGVLLCRPTNFCAGRPTTLVASTPAHQGQQRSSCLGYRVAACRSIQLLVLLARSEEHTSELQSRVDLVCRLLLEKKK